MERNYVSGIVLQENYLEEIFVKYEINLIIMYFSNYYYISEIFLYENNFVDFKLILLYVLNNSLIVNVKLLTLLMWIYWCC